MTSAARAFFQEHGYLIARGAVAPGRVAELEAALDSVRAELPAAEPGTVWEVAGLSRFRAEMAAHVRDVGIAALVAEVLDAVALQLLQDTALVKLARVGGRVAWHQDHTYTGYLSPPRLVTARLALTPCTRASGCLEVLDGSHLWGALGELRPFTEDGVVDVMGDGQLEHRGRVVPLELEPGDVSLHHCLTVHGSGPNGSDFDRKTLVSRLFDASSVLMAERLPEAVREHFPTREGLRLDFAAFPQVFPPG